MPRPPQLDLRSADQPWQVASMPGANGPIDLVRLASSTAPFSMLGRFSAGFERPVAGGYLCAEEFVVLVGELVLDGSRVGVGDLVHIGARRLRRDLRSPQGAVVLAWFDGAPEFVAPEVCDEEGAPMEVHNLGERFRMGDEVIRTPVARWHRGPAGDWPPGADGFDARDWAASPQAWVGSGDRWVTWREPMAEVRPKRAGRRR